MNGKCLEDGLLWKVVLECIVIGCTGVHFSAEYFATVLLVHLHLHLCSRCPRNVWGIASAALAASMMEVHYEDDIGEDVVWDDNDAGDMWGVATHSW